MMRLQSPLVGMIVQGPEDGSLGYPDPSENRFSEVWVPETRMVKQGSSHDAYMAYQYIPFQ